MAEQSDELTRHPHANYTDGLRDLASMDHVSSDLAGVLCDCADLIDALALPEPPTTEGSKP